MRRTAIWVVVLPIIGLVRMTTLALALTALLLLSEPDATPAHALFGSIHVTSLADNNTHGDGLCTLREAIDNANNAGDVTSGDCAAGDVVDFIDFRVSGTIVLTSLAGAALPISAFVTVDGGNAITLSGGDAVPMFIVSPGWSLTLNNILLTNGSAGSGPGGAVYVIGATLVLNNTTIQNSHTNGFAGGAIYASGGAITLNGSLLQGNTGYDYGAINSTGAVTLTHSVVRNNIATTGGGALSVGGVVNISDSQIDGNTASTNNGGGIYITLSGKVRISNSRIDSNHAPMNRGGAIYSEGVLTITQSTLSGNAGAQGGAIFNTGTATLNNSTLTGNSASDSGGAILNLFLATLNNVALSGNSAGNGGGMYTLGKATLNGSTLSGNTATYGGGIYHNGGTATLSNSTLSGNTATQAGGGFYLREFAEAWLRNVTLSGNTATQAGGALYISPTAQAALTNTILAYSPSGGNCSGTIASSKYTFSSDNSCALPPADTIKGQNPNGLDPLLTALGNYGGPTQVHMIPVNSPAKDGVVGSDAPLVDQRGLPRPGPDGSYDIGAVERQDADSDLAPRLFLPALLR